MRRPGATGYGVFLGVLVVIAALWVGVAPHKGFWIWGELEFTPVERASLNLSQAADALRSRGYAVASVQGGPGQAFGEIFVLNDSAPDFQAWIRNLDGATPDARIYGELRYESWWGAGSSRFGLAAAQARENVTVIATDLGFTVNDGRIAVDDTFDAFVDVSVRVAAIWVALVVGAVVVAFSIRRFMSLRSYDRSA